LAQIAADKAASDDVAGALFDGFPRTEPQARALDDILAAQGESVTVVIEIDVPRERLVNRLAGRRTCEQCGTVYHVQSDPPQVEGICDKCGGSLVQREDDTPEAITRRLALYDQLTAPLLEYYASRGMLERINGDQDIDAVERAVLAAIEARAENQKA
jgi:adenylate kinase